MNVVEWVVWGLGFGWAVFSFVSFIGDVFYPNPIAQPTGSGVFFSPTIKRLISGFYVVGMAIALAVTAIGDYSKLHLLWFVPIWHFFGTQWIGLIYEKVTLCRTEPFSNQPLTNSKLSDAVYSYNSCKDVIRNVREQGYSSKQAFWISFAIGSLHPFLYEEEDAEVMEIEDAIQLSVIFDIFFTVYREEVDRDTKVKDTKVERWQFLKILEMHFDLIRNIVYKGNPDYVGRQLFRFLYDALKATSDSVADLNPLQLAEAVQYIVGIVEESAHECKTRFKLIRDL
jgi:hypothetical protein